MMPTEASSTEPPCFFCGDRPAPIFVIGSPRYDDDGEIVGVRHQRACKKCAEKPLLELLRMIRCRGG